MRGIKQLVGTGVAVAAALALQAGGATAAFATSGTTTHYTSAYSMDFTGFVADGYTGPADLGYWTCSGVRVTNAHQVRDNFTCSTTATNVTATFSGSKPWPCGCSGWASDLDGLETNNYEIDIANGTVEGWAIYS